MVKASHTGLVWGDQHVWERRDTVCQTSWWEELPGGFRAEQVGWGGET
jgi:hypothetical protein